MSRINTALNHIPPDNEVTMKMFNYLVAEKDPKKICNPDIKQFHKCVSFHNGDFRFCASEYYKFVKCIRNLEKKQ